MDSEIITYGIPDAEFIRGNVPMTKEEVRTITLSKLRLCAGDRVLDIGAGTGSISIEVARIVETGTVFAVEKNPDAVLLIQQNARKFAVSNLQIIEGSAPESIRNIFNINKIIIGGTGGHLQSVLEWIAELKNNDLRIVVNAITLDTLTVCEQFFSKNGYKNIEIIQVSIHKFERVGKHNMLKANTPVFILSADK